MAQITNSTEWKFVNIAYANEPSMLPTPIGYIQDNNGNYIWALEQHITFTGPTQITWAITNSPIGRTTLTQKAGETATFYYSEVIKANNIILPSNSDWIQNKTGYCQYSEQLGSQTIKHEWHSTAENQKLEMLNDRFYHIPSRHYDYTPFYSTLYEFRIIVYDRQLTGSINIDQERYSFDYDNDGAVQVASGSSIYVEGESTGCYIPSDTEETNIPTSGYEYPDLYFKHTYTMGSVNQSIEWRASQIKRWKIGKYGSYIKNLEIVFPNATVHNFTSSSETIFIKPDTTVRPAATVTDDRLYYVHYQCYGSNYYTWSGNEFSQGALYPTSYTGHSAPEYFFTNVYGVAYTYINLKYKSGDVWEFTNTNNVSIDMGYNTKKCNEGDAHNWVNLADKVTVTVAPKATKPLHIANNWWANTVCCCYITGYSSKYRWISYLVDGQSTAKYNRINA